MPLLNFIDLTNDFLYSSSSVQVKHIHCLTLTKSLQIFLR